MLHHISLGTSDLDRSRAFYDAALLPLGYVRVWQYDDAIGYGPPGGGDKLALKLTASDQRLAAGPRFHLALAAPSRAAVVAFHAAAVSCGGVCDGPPGLRERYAPDYYAAFVVDPDGHRLEAVTRSS